MTEKWPLYLAALGFYLCILTLIAFMSPRRKELKMPRMIIEGCEAKQRSDQMVCDACGLVWDVNDSMPPDCKPIGSRPLQTIIGGHKPAQAFTGKGFKPLTLPRGAGSEMPEDRPVPNDVLMRHVYPPYYGTRVEGARIEAFADMPSKTDWDRMEAELEAFRAAEDDRDAEREAIEREATAAASRERIIAAAVQVEGVTLSLPIPARHGEVISSADAMHLPEYAIHGATQGFLTSAGRFVNRVQAKQIAHMAGQPQLRPEHERHQRDLFSEDLW